MVSFFGLKIGGEKKKKSSRDLQISAPKPRNLDLDDSNAIGSNFFNFQGAPTPSYEASVYSLSRQESGQSTSSIASKFKGFKKVAPFASNKFGSSMVDLPTPPSLRHHASNPSLGRRWNTGSSTNLSFAPPSFNPMARPSTSDGKNKTWVNPLDVHFKRDSSKSGFRGPLSPASTMRDDGQPLTPLSATPRSPLGQYELKLDLPDDVSSFADFGNFNVEAPAPLRIKKSTSTRLAAGLQTKSQSPQKPPSPPQSITDKEVIENIIPEPPSKLPTAEMRPQSAHSRRSIPSGFEELQNAITKFGPASLPSPSTTPRASEEKPPAASMSSRSASPHTKRGSAKPIIQNVRAKRDTLTINPQRRRSLQMRIEAAESNSVPSLSLVDRPKTSGNGRLLERPPPLTLNTGFRLSAADHDGPRSAPFLPIPTRSLTPAGVGSPLRPRAGVQGEYSHPVSVNENNERRLELDSPSGSSVYEDNDDDMYHHPPSPESTSPVIPLSGPLASPRFPPSPSPHSYVGAFSFPRKDEGDADRSLSPTTPPVPPRSLRRNLPTSDSTYWPLPSPVAHSSDRIAMSPSSADSRLRSESESGSLNSYEPLEPPRIPATRSESPTFRSFSRPWTPTTTGEFTAPPLRRVETAGPLSGLGTGGEFGGGLRPPPRSATVKTPKTEVGALRSSSARAGENGLGAGFI
ncbi:hypothetical protein F5Y10DRAFT_216856 [Nemania abortiva]|nr:hypothetical protein F5Y10DRAFT_216856 [Nemania abortiva]